MEAPQVYLVTKEGIFQKGAAGTDGIFIFKTPPKSANLFAAAPGFEGEKITYNGQKTVSITMKESDTRNSAIGNPSLTLEGKGGRINVYSADWMTCSGISFPETKRHWWISLAYAVRRTESVENAEAILLRAQAIHPKVAMIAFNLACYASVAGRMVEAKEQLRCAIKLDKDIRGMALDDEDLKPLWDWIGGLE